MMALRQARELMEQLREKYPDVPEEIIIKEVRKRRLREGIYTLAEETNEYVAFEVSTAFELEGLDDWYRLKAAAEEVGADVVVSQTPNTYMLIKDGQEIGALTNLVEWDLIFYKNLPEDEMGRILEAFARVFQKK